MIAASMSAVLVGLSGCGDDRHGIGSGGFVEGGTLTVYVSLPRSSSPAAADMVDGAKLALHRSGGRRGAYNVNAAFLDSSPVAAASSPASDPGATDPVRALANARAALSDAQTAVVIADVDSRAATQSIPILNAGGILQISPGAEYAGLTSATGAVEAGEPERFAPAGEPSYVRLVPSDVARLDAYVSAVRSARPRGGRVIRVALEADATQSGRSLGAALGSRLASERGVRRVDDAAAADVVVFAGEDVGTAAAVYESAAADAVLVGGDAVGRSGLATWLPPSVAGRLRIVTAAPRLRADSPFVDDFERRFGRRPSGYAAVGAEAMNLALDAIARAGNAAGLRQDLIDAARSTRLTNTLLGDISIDPASGDPAGVRLHVVPATSPAVAPPSP